MRIQSAIMPELCMSLHSQLTLLWKQPTQLVDKAIITYSRGVSTKPALWTGLWTCLWTHYQLWTEFTDEFWIVQCIRDQSKVVSSRNGKCVQLSARMHGWLIAYLCSQKFQARLVDRKLCLKKGRK